MKKIYNLILIPFAFALTSCELDLYPVTDYNQGNVQVENDEQASESPYKTRNDIEGLRNTMYSTWIKDIPVTIQTWYLYSDSRADNAYCGNPGNGALTSIESNKLDGENKFIKKSWDFFLTAISNCNNIICNIDRVKENDSSMTEKEYGEWLSEAYCWRAWAAYNMVQLWGDFPFLTTIPPSINAENVGDVYELYYPASTPRAEILDQLIKDLDYAVLHGPEVNHENKFILSKAFAHGMLARIYSSQLKRDWNKVAEHCTAIEGMGFTLVDDFDELWAYDEVDANRNTSESIFEVVYSRSESTNYLWKMFHRNAYDPMAEYKWNKWVTPSRDIVAAYDAQGDTERKNASIIYDKCGWMNYYPKDNYAFMHKMRTNANSIMLMRLGEIYLLHAEALAGQGNFSKATEYVNKIRTRAGIKTIVTPSSEEAMVDAILDERRLELAFEGFRFFDLVRYDLAKLQKIQMNVTENDKSWKPRNQFTQETLLCPIPQVELDNNSNLHQNPGY